ncbi:nucleotidyltransferase domain-containing protein [Candidatus Woesearchaeota archaeon]|nr:nucleotidyltransferase domain-containing protein [Candidatus Woesearchaeota archaeon]
MGQMDKNLDKILELFFEFPNEKFTIRGIAKKAKIPKSTVQNYLTKLKSAGLVTKDNQASNTRFFKIKKIHYFIEKIYASGMIDHLNKVYMPSCIILFGSFRKGDSVNTSDIDIFLATTKKDEVDLKKFEQKLKHKVQIFKEADMGNLPDNLFNNIVNGIKLEGSFKVK